ncbi:hypothetical protein D3C81_1742450 [compost metagenome]
MFLQFRCLLYRSHGSGQTVPHFFRSFLYIKRQLFYIRFHQFSAARLHGNDPAVALDNFPYFLSWKFGIIFGQNQHNIAYLGIVAVCILPGITVQKYFLT